MLLRHSAIYMFARGIPSLLGFATIVIYTRLLSPDAYGQYTLVVTGAVLVNAVLYQWLSASLLRFLPQYRDNETGLLAAILSGYIFVSFLAGLGGALFASVWWDSTWGKLIVIGVFLVWMQSWFTINLELVRSHLAPIRYGLISTLRGAIALGLGAALVLLEFNAYGALVGLVLGYFVSACWASWGKWSLLRLRQLDRKLVRSLLVYGLPLTASFALGTIISSSDRFMLAWLIDESAAGLYAAGQGLVQQTIIAFMTVVHLAAYPLILRTLDDSGPDAARAQLRKNAVLLFGIGMPVAAAFVILSPNIVQIFLGEEFQAAAIELLPWFAIATLFWCARAYYFDLAFYLGKRTNIHLAIMSMAAVLNVVLNYWLIPVFGLLGAVYAAVFAHFVAVVLSIIVGRRAFCLPKIHTDIIGLLSATLIMTIPLLIIPDGGGVLRLLLSIVVAAVVYIGGLYVFNPGEVRQAATRLLLKTKLP